jgi:hypothetical protein
VLLASTVLAFTSDGSSRREVYVRAFPPGDGEWAISIAGGDQPRWRGDGQQLFFEATDGKIMAVSVKASAGTTFSRDRDRRGSLRRAPGRFRESQYAAI